VLGAGAEPPACSRIWWSAEEIARDDASAMRHAKGLQNEVADAKKNVRKRKRKKKK
jgi:hypothetical protein